MAEEERVPNGQGGWRDPIRRQQSPGGGASNNNDAPIIIEEPPEEEDVHALRTYDHTVAVIHEQQRFKMIQQMGAVNLRLRREMDNTAEDLDILARDIQEVREFGKSHQSDTKKSFAALDRDLDRRFQIMESNRKEDGKKFQQLEEKVAALQKTFEARTTAIAKTLGELEHQFRHMNNMHFPPNETTVPRMKTRQ